MVQENGKKRNRNRNKNKNKGGNQPQQQQAAQPEAQDGAAAAPVAAPAPQAPAPAPAPAPVPKEPEPVAQALVNGNDGPSPAERREELIKNLSKDFASSGANFLELREAERKYALMVQGKKVGSIHVDGESVPLSFNRDHDWVQDANGDEGDEEEVVETKASKKQQAKQAKAGKASKPTAGDEPEVGISLLSCRDFFPPSHLQYLRLP